MSPTSAPLGEGEVARGLARLESGQAELRKENAAGLASIHEKLDSRPTWTDLDRITKSMQDDIDELQDGSKWTTRSIVGAFILALAGIVWSGPIHLP